jgi:DNA-binding winged helix-turn-helix (wHTH) protein/tetratricopeptide (TPR) repeat protein
MQENISYEFDSFRLIPAERQLLRGDQSLALPPKAFETLLILVENHGHVLKKDDLMNRIWPNSFVAENSLNHNIAVIRKALNGDGHGDGYIETVRGYGFRFNAQVSVGSVLFGHKATRVVVREEQSESVKTVTTTTRITTKASPLRNLAVLALASAVVLAIVIGAYFLFIRPGQTRNARSPIVSGSSKPWVEKPAAREAYLKGRYFWNKRTHEDVLKAQVEFQRALDIDPNYAPAYAGLADCMLTGGAVPTSMSAKDLALKALSIDENLAEAHTSLAYWFSAVEWKWQDAEAEFEKAITLDPNYATAHHWHAYNLASLGRTDEAVNEIKKAEATDPLSAIIKTDVGHILYFARRYDEAAAQYLKALELDPNFRVAHWRLGETYIQLRRYDEAITELQTAIKLDSDKESEITPWLACAYVAANRGSDAVKILRGREPEAEALHHTYEVGLIYAALGDRQSAISWLEKSFGYREGKLAVLKVEPMLENLRSDGRFDALLRRMNLN